MPSVHKVVIQALKILQQMLKDFQRVFDHFADIRCYSVKWLCSWEPLQHILRTR